MVSIEIKFACGCGFKTGSMEEAAEHVEKTGHVITSVACKVEKKG